MQIHIEFVGGPLDGTYLRRDSSDPVEARAAQSCYWATKGGTIGEHYRPAGGADIHQVRKYPSPDQDEQPPRDYVVTVCVEDHRGIFIRLECAEEDLRA